MLQDYYTLIIGGTVGVEVEVVSLDPTSYFIPNYTKVVGNIPIPINGAVGTTFGKLMRMMKKSEASFQNGGNIFLPFPFKIMYLICVEVFLVLSTLTNAGNITAIPINGSMSQG